MREASNPWRSDHGAEEIDAVGILSLDVGEIGSQLQHDSLLARPGLGAPDSSAEGSDVATSPLAGGISIQLQLAGEQGSEPLRWNGVG